VNKTEFGVTGWGKSPLQEKNRGERKLLIFTAGNPPEGQL
jgi:hypothetical protein